jgi:hypothetical protein
MKWQKHASTLVLLVLAVPLAIYAYRDRTSISDTERRDRQTDVFPAYRRQDVSRIELTEGGVKTTFERRPAGDAGDMDWWMTSPDLEKADAASVDKFLGDIEFAGILRKVDPSVASFDAPRVTGTLTMGKIVYRFALGGDAPTPKGAAYFEVVGEGAFVVSKDFVTSLLKGPDAYRERTIVPYLSLEIARLEVTGQGAHFTLERLDDVSFKLPDLGLRASRETLDRVWSALGEARAESFLPDEAAEQALGPDPVTVRMKPRDAMRDGTSPALPERGPHLEDGELLFGGPCPGHPEDIVAVRRAPTKRSACVPKGLLPGLIVTSPELVDTRLFAARADEVAELTLESVPPGKKVEIARKGTGWHERAPTDRELSGEQTDAANALVSALTKGDGKLAEGSPKIPATIARVRIGRGDGKGDESIELAGALSGIAWVKRTSDGATLEVSEALAHKLVPSEIVFRGRQLFDTLMLSRLATHVDAECDGVVQSLTRGPEGWTFDKPAGYAADNALVATVASNVLRARADSWVADTDDGSFGMDGTSPATPERGPGEDGTSPATPERGPHLAAKSCAITVTVDKEGTPFKAGIVYGRAAGGGGYYAHLLGEEAVFLAPKSLRDDAAGLLLDRTGFRVDSADVETLTLSGGGSKVVFHGQGHKLVLADGSRSSVSDVGEKVAVALDGMHADDVVHLGPPRPAEGFKSPSLDVRIKTRGDAGVKEVHFVVGDAAIISKERMFYARLDGVDATFALARDRIGDLLSAL